jgi:hypothetical protein
MMPGEDKSNEAPGCVPRFTLQSLFMRTALIALVCTWFSPAFWDAWRKHSQEMEPGDREWLQAMFGWGILAWVALQIVSLNDAVERWKRRRERPSANAIEQRLFDSHFVKAFNLALAATPVIFLLLPVSFARTPKSAMVIFTITYLSSFFIIHAWSWTHAPRVRWFTTLTGRSATIVCPQCRNRSPISTLQRKARVFQCQHCGYEGRTDNS